MVQHRSLARSQGANDQSSLITEETNESLLSSIFASIIPAIKPLETMQIDQEADQSTEIDKDELVEKQPETSVVVEQQISTQHSKKTVMKMVIPPLKQVQRKKYRYCDIVSSSDFIHTYIHSYISF